MKQKTALVLYYNSSNRFSFNALVGALEIDEYFNDLTIYFTQQTEELIEVLKDIVEKYERVVVGLSFFTTQIWDILALMRELRRNYGRKFIAIAGGAHPIGEPQRTLEMGIDIVVTGEGEETFGEILKKIMEGSDYTEVKGIAFLAGREYRHTGNPLPVDIDRYPPFMVRHRRFGPIEITRGCPFGCGFCQNSRIFGRRPRHRSIEKICKYVDILKGHRDVRFITPNAFSYGSPDGKTLSLPGLEELLKSVRQTIGLYGRMFIGSFPSEVRPESATEETIALVLKYADNDNLTIGAQSGSQRMLNLCGREHTVADIYNAVSLTRKAGLKANVDFIFGLPEETQEDVKLSVEVMEDLVKMGARIHAHTFLPLPKTPFAKKEAVPLSPEMRNTIARLVGKGALFGNWRKQEQLAEKIAKYMIEK